MVEPQIEGHRIMVLASKSISNVPSVDVTHFDTRLQCHVWYMEASGDKDSAIDLSDGRVHHRENHNGKIE